MARLNPAALPDCRRAWVPLALLLILTYSCAALASAHAQTASPDVAGELLLLESTERGLDPLGLDENTGAALDRAAERLDEARRKRAVQPPPQAVTGEVLTALEQVRETAHTAELRLAMGLAFVHIAMTFASRSTLPAQVAYRLPLPDGAAPYALEVCRAGRCRRASPAAADVARSTDSAHAAEGRCELCIEGEVIHDARGRALALRASPVTKGTPVSVRVDYVAPAPLHGGMVRFRLPARGYDPRAAEAQVELDAPGLIVRSPTENLRLEPNLGLEVVAELDPAQATRAQLTRASCGGAPCSRSFEAAQVAPLVARETWLLLDASPSMEGPARGRADTLLAALLATLPESTALRVFAFGARAREVGRFVAEATPLAVLSDALGDELGAQSRPGAVFALPGLELPRVRPRVLLVSDAKFDHAALRALSSARKHGAELWLLALEEPPLQAQQLFDGVVPVFSTQDPARMEELLSAALSAPFKPGLRHGEQRVRERLPRRPFVPREGDSWLSFWAARSRALSFHGGEPSESALVTAPAFRDAEPKAPVASTGMPKESVLSMLRTQLIPQARACLRSDRKGRGDYAVALTFHALFADREAYDTRIEGAVPDALRKCLGDVLARLRIPLFNGRIRVRYPIHTEREPEPPMLELEPEALEQVNRVIGAQ